MGMQSMSSAKREWLRKKLLHKGAVSASRVSSSYSPTGINNSWMFGYVNP